MAEIIQNIDQDQSNPLGANTIPSLKKFSFPNNPKVRILIGLGAFIFILLIVSLLIPQKKLPEKITSKPTSTPTISSTPVDNSQIPTQFQEKFQNIQNELDQKEDFPFPVIDPDIGL
jgi:hypothetical protein